MSDWMAWVERSVLNQQLNGSLVQRLWIDVFLPMVSVQGILSFEQGMAIWFHSRPASFPESYRELFRLASVRCDHACSLHNGWVQGIYWMEDQLRLERVRSSLGQQTLPLGGSDA